jgi:hypothetical protein
VSHGTVSNYWRRWLELDFRLIVESDRKGRYVRLFDLAEIGLPLEVT